MVLSDPPGADLLPDAAYADQVNALLIAIRDAPDIDRAAERVEQRLAILRDRRFLGEFLRYLSLAPRERMTILLLSLPIEQALRSIPPERWSPVDLALALFFAEGDRAAFFARAAPYLDPAFYTALEEIATTAARRPDLDTALARDLLAGWRRQGRRMLRIWAAALVRESLEQLLQVPAPRFLHVVLQQARRSLGSDLTHLPAVYASFQTGDNEDELALAFCAWAVQRAVQVTNELPQAELPVLADILRLDASLVLRTWLAQAVQDERAEAFTMCVRLKSWLVELPDPVTAPPPLPVLQRLAQATSTAEVRDLVREEPWLLHEAFMDADGDEDAAYFHLFLLDPLADQASLGLALREIGRLRVEIVRPEHNAVLVAARAVHAETHTEEAAVARLLAGGRPDELALIGADLALVDAHDTNPPFALTLAVINNRLAAAYPDRPVLQASAALSLAQAALNARDSDSVRPLAERALALARPTRHAIMLPAALHTLAQIQAAAGDLGDAHAALTEAFNIALALPPPFGRGDLLLGLAEVAVEMRDYDHLAYYLDLIEHYGLANETTTNAGRYWARRGQLFWARGIGTEAAQAWGRAATIASRLGDGVLLSVLVAQALREQRPDEALSLLNEMLTAAEQAGEAVKAGWLVTRKLAVLLDLPDRDAELPAAYAQFGRLVAAADLTNNPLWGPTVALIQAGYLQRFGSRTQAQAVVAEATTRAARHGQTADWAQVVLMQVGDVAQQNDFATAHALLDQVRAMGDTLPVMLQVSLRFSEGLVQARQAQALADAGRTAAAAELRAAAAVSWRAVATDPHANRDVRLSVLNNLGLLYRHMADRSGLRWTIHLQAALFDEGDAP